MEYVINILVLITAHIFGDYVFQSQYIAETKKDNIYHLIVHCWIYTFCFTCALACIGEFMLGILIGVFLSHVVIDYLKGFLSEKYGEKAYVLDQVLHYVIIILVFIFIMK